MKEKSQQQYEEQILASAVAYLIEGGDTHLAEQLAFCTVESVGTVHISDNGEVVEFYQGVYLRGPRAACDLINNQSPERDLACNAFNAALPYGEHLSDLQVRATVHVPDANWRTELLELAKGNGVSNQASGAATDHLWQGFKFRSATEIRIAVALDRVGVLFFPLPKSRLSTPEGRRNREPDFLICDEGRWGILEVDGGPFHPPQRSAMEHQRDRLFLDHGVKVVQRFDATDCFATPDKVVADFCRILKRAYA